MTQTTGGSAPRPPSGPSDTAQRTRPPSSASDAAQRTRRERGADRSAAPFPAPTPTPDSRPFWDATRAGELRLQRCDRGHWRFPPAPLCPECWSRVFTWERTGGRGTVVTHVTFRRLYDKAFEPLLPYTVAIVELDEGPRLTTRLVGVAPDDVRGGMKVEVTFEPATDEITLPLFRPATSRRSSEERGYRRQGPLPLRRDERVHAPQRVSAAKPRD